MTGIKPIDDLCSKANKSGSRCLQQGSTNGCMSFWRFGHEGMRLRLWLKSVIRRSIPHDQISLFVFFCDN